ncbi:probable C-mannosyltransferase DPY19L1 [Mizuhopecten yessoensis]|uniref:C-mannosyltransferase DPY19L1 n=1 Tax=Mizuhopecten yessoensis TaxID=6573 RepID=A0A210QMZ7_MIZYE|nr:probable C-mannosyltransferase DPY19L1 [Mizuhopecten yessoensis]OWF50081.1 C-mannosyltransferase DPY19L1 [Mizuhopecten yessoensis]
MAPRKRNTTQNTNNSSQNQSRKKGSKRQDDKIREMSETEGIPWSYLALVLLLAAVIGVAHRNHIAGMFERDRHFSHLSTLERELAFRTEMGLYYSYYKTMIETNTFNNGLNKIMYDNITEYPLTINTLKRFNLYPEAALAVGYRAYESFWAYLKKPTKQCWTVNRGEGKTPVQSCEGLGEPSYFYIENVFFLNGVMMSVFFLFGTYLSGSVFGGILTVASFFYNHGECTRSMWTPPLRESFAYPVFVVQMLLVTHVIKMRIPSYKFSGLIALITVSFMLAWQFAQFALLTQTLAVFATYALGYIGSHKVKVIMMGQLTGLLVSFAALFGNEMLLTSFFASCLVTVMIIVILEPYLEKLNYRILILATQGVLLILGTVGLKVALSTLLRVADDAHIGEIFRSKFSDFKNFHTMLYTCAKEFNFMEKETPEKVLKTLLAPSVAVAVVAVMFQLLEREYKMWNADTKKQADSDDPEDNESQHRGKPHAELVYHLFQLLAFTAMAVLIMRLKLFWTPHMCLMTSLLASRQLFSWIGSRERQLAIVFLVLAGMSVQGIQNLQHQWSIMGEYSNYPLEELVEWVQTKTPKRAVFAGPMPTMATIKLCTGRPIVNHPHYEDAGLRERTKDVYTMYSRKPAEEVKNIFKKLKVQYAILEESWCNRRSGVGCSMPEIWDIEDKVNRGKQPLCQKLLINAEPHFKRVFRNGVYQVLKIT